MLTLSVGKERTQGGGHGRSGSGATLRIGQASFDAHAVRCGSFRQSAAGFMRKDGPADVSPASAGRKTAIRGLAASLGKAVMFYPSLLQDFA